MIARAVILTPAATYRRCCWLAVAAVLLSLICATAPPLAHDPPALPFTRPGRAPSAPAAPRTAPIVPSGQRVPHGLAPVLNATLAAGAGEDYAVAPAAAPDAGLRAANPASDFSVLFDAGGARITPTGGAAWSLRTVAIHTDRGDIPLAAMPPALAGARVEYRRDGLTEWYVNGPRGLEQGFTLDAPPAGSDTFALALAVDGAGVARADDGALEIGGLRYGGLEVVDAAGATLPAHLDVTEGGLRIAVDATGAQWPLTVDPTVATLTASSGNASNQFGSSVAAATASGTTTVVVGAPTETDSFSHATGAAYVFTGSGSTYTQRAVLRGSDLVGPDKTNNYYFGVSVAITIGGGTATILVGASNASQAYVFTGAAGGSTYTQQAILSAPDASNNNSFGHSVAAATNGATTTIAIGASGQTVGGVAAGAVYLFAGSGSSYPLQTELTGDNAPGGSFGYSVAIAANGGTNTVVVSELNYSKPSTPTVYQGGVFVFTGSGASYSSVVLTASDGAAGDYFGYGVAVAVSGGTNTIAVGAPTATVSGITHEGKAYVLIGSGSSYTQTILTNSNPWAGGDEFGWSVAAGFASSGAMLIAVGAIEAASGSDPNAGVYVFTSGDGGASFARQSLPQANAGAGTLYGTSVAIATDGSGNATAVGGAPYSSPAVTVSAFSTTPQYGLIDVFGQNSQTAASPAGTFTGSPFDLVADVTDPSYAHDLPGIGVTFTINAAGGAGGSFSSSSSVTTAHATTQDAASGLLGLTPDVLVYPSSTSGAFTVTASVDGASPPVTLTYNLSIVALTPTPSINAVTVDPATSGLIPSQMPVSPAVDFYVQIIGSGFTSASTVYYNSNINPNVAQKTVYIDQHTLAVFIDHTLPTAPGQTGIYVANPTGGGGGGNSNQVALAIVAPTPAPSGSTAAPTGSTALLVAPNTPFVLATDVTTGIGGAAIATGTANKMVGGLSGVVSQGGGNLITQDGGSLVSDNGLGVVSQGGGNLIGNDSASIAGPPIGAKAGTTQPATVQKPNPGSAPGKPAPSAPRRATRSNLPARGDFSSGTDAAGSFFSPVSVSNGRAGTYDRTVSIDGISQSVTFHITNLDPADGHPATITSLSRTGAAGGDPAFDLTITGTGFVGGSVISYGGVQLPTTFLSATQVKAHIPALLLRYTGTMKVLVINPDPNGGASLPATFTVTQPMALAYLNPNAISPASAQFLLKVNGANFRNGSTVTWNGTNLTTTFVSATQLTATVPANLVAQAGTATVKVVDPLGGTTSGVTFTIMVINALPSPEPSASPVTGPSPLPGSRQPSGPGSGGSPPNPLPTSR